MAFHVNGWPIRWYMVLQHLSSVVGMLALLIWAWRLPPIHSIQRTLPSTSHRTRVRAVAVLVASSLGFAITRCALHSDMWFMRRLFHFAIGGMTGWVMAWFVIAISITLSGLTAPIPRE